MIDGLLGSSWDDPRTMGALQLAQGLLSAPKAMQGLSQGLLGYQQAMAMGKRAKSEEEDRKMRQQLQALQLQQAQQQMAQQQAQAARQQQIEQAYRGSIVSPAQQALAGGGGPTQANAVAMQGLRPQLDQGRLIEGLLQADPMTAYQMMQPKPADYKVVGGSLVQVGPDGVKEAYRAPDKPEAAPSAVREYEFAKSQGYGGSFLDFQLAQKRAGANSVSINTGQKGMENELKLRGEFKSEPVYKAQQEMQSAYGQIKQAIAQASPAGDLAAATKIMKLLDPGSVVRESELGMAMAATGLLDRVTNYAGLIVSGQKLTPTQRKDFQTLADRLYGESVNSYNQKRSEYSGFAKDYGLDPNRVVGKQASPPSNAGGWSITPVN